MIEIKHLKDMYNGHSAFLICSGPSFDGVDKTLLKYPGIITMGLNNSAKNFRPNLWCCVDSPSRFLGSIYSDPTILKFLPNGHQKTVDANGAFFKTNLEFNADTFLEEDTFNYGLKGKDGGCRSVMLPALKILYHLGFTRIFLLGADFKMVDGEDNYHFKQSTSKHSVRSNNNTYGALIERFTLLKPKFAEKGVGIYNCNPDSILDVFPYISLEAAVEIVTENISDIENESTDGMYKPRKKKKHTPNKGIDMSVPPLKMQVRKQICLSGMARSGNHAILNWIASQHKGRVEFRNNVSHICSEKFLSDPKSCNIPGRLWRLPNQPEWVGGEPKLFLYSRENEVVPQVELLSEIDASVTKKIVVLRDPFNLLASSLEYFKSGKRSIWFGGKWIGKSDLLDTSLFANKWLEYASLFDSNDVIGINYNRWVVSEEYRDEMADKIGVDFRTDESMSAVPRNGGGSSFDRTDLNGSGKSMGVNERWRSYATDEDYLDIFKQNPELEVVSNRIFGEVISNDT